MRYKMSSKALKLTKTTRQQSYLFNYLLSMEDLQLNKSYIKTSYIALQLKIKHFDSDEKSQMKYPLK